MPDDIHLALLSTISPWQWRSRESLWWDRKRYPQDPKKDIIILLVCQTPMVTSWDIWRPVYGCESWTLAATMTKKIQAYENKWFWWQPHIPWAECNTNNFVRWQITAITSPQELYVATAKRKTSARYGHVTRHDFLVGNNWKRKNIWILVKPVHL